MVEYVVKMEKPYDIGKALHYFNVPFVEIRRVDNTFKEELTGGESMSDRIKEDNPLTNKRGWTVGIPTEDGDYIVCMSDSISTPMHVPCTVRNGKPFISMVYDTKQRTIRAYMPFKPYLR